MVPTGDEGGELTNGGNQPGNITLADLDQWTFTAAEGHFIQLTLGRRSDNLYPQIRLISPTGEIVAETRHISSAVEIVVENAPVSGTYRVVVGANGVSSIGEYVLTGTW